MKTKIKCKIRPYHPFNRWVILAAHDLGLAWSGSQWVSLFGSVQVSNFDTEADAEKEAIALSFEVVDKQTVKKPYGATMSDPRVEKMVLYAWVGEDELGSGEMGIKQGLVPAGCIPLVACKWGKVDRQYVVDQLQAQASACGKTIRLCKFVFEDEIITLEP